MSRDIQLLGWEGEAPSEAFVVRGVPLYFDGGQHFLGETPLEPSQLSLLEQGGFLTLLRSPISVSDCRRRLLVARRDAPSYFRIRNATEIDSFALSAYRTDADVAAAIGEIVDRIAAEYIAGVDIPSKVISSAFALAPRSPKIHALCVVCATAERRSYVLRRARALIAERNYREFDALLEDLIGARTTVQRQRVVLPFATLDLPLASGPHQSLVGFLAISVANIRYLCVGKQRVDATDWFFAVADPAIEEAEPDDFVNGFERPIEGRVHFACVSNDGSVVDYRTLERTRLKAGDVALGPPRPSAATRVNVRSTRALPAKARTQIRIARRNGEPVRQGAIGNVLATFEPIRSQYGAGRLAEHVAFGSFEVAATTVFSEDFELLRMLQHVATGPRVRSASLERVDTGNLRAFLAALVDADVTFSLTLLESSGATRDSVQVVPEAARAWVAMLSSEYRFLGPEHIPQADNLEKIIAFCAGKPMNVVERQEKYYATAARILGLWDGELTRLGWRLVRVPVGDAYEVVRTAFEATECARTWAEWSDVASVGRCDPASATEFLTDRARGLSFATVKRRARTLSAWHEALYPVKQ